MKGNATNGTVKVLIGLLIVLIFVGALAGTIFTSINSTALASAPSWVATTLPIVAGVGLVILLLKVVGVW